MALDRKKIKPPSPEAFGAKQLSLFQSFLCNSDAERDNLSNTIELWDGVPKYFISRQEMTKRREKGLLPTIDREFEYRGRAFTIKVRPARLTDEGGNDKEFYPSAREELVEDALRKIAAEQHYGFLETQESGVIFTLHVLRRELQRRGHTLSYEEVTESLDIMAGCRIEIMAADGTGDYKSPILAGLVRVSRHHYREDPKARWVAYFNPLVTRSIQALSFRQYDYHTMMSHTTQLARWMHKRMAHNYVNASLMQPYTILFSTVQRDSGLLEYARDRDAIRKLDEALGELKTKKVLMFFKKEDRKGERGRILDVVYTITPDPGFVGQIKAANKRHTDGVGKPPPGTAGTGGTHKVPLQNKYE
ncbi:MAG: replication protein [Candidatus Competibacter denitrificans]|jgi:hypothetical protein